MLMKDEPKNPKPISHSGGKFLATHYLEEKPQAEEVVKEQPKKKSSKKK